MKTNSGGSIFDRYEISHLTMLIVNIFTGGGVIWMWPCIKYLMACSVVEMEEFVCFRHVSIYSTGLAALLWWIFSKLSSLRWPGCWQWKRTYRNISFFSTKANMPCLYMRCLFCDWKGNGRGEKRRQKITFGVMVNLYIHWFVNVTQLRRCWRWENHSIGAEN